jgi:hypothetical protein
MFDRPIIVDWRGLKRMGWPYSRAQTWRLMADAITVTEKVNGRKTRVARRIPNPDPFPRCFKLTSHHNGHPVWRVSELLAYFEAHGLKVTEDWNAA